jgi:hypothetical protein
MLSSERYTSLSFSQPRLWRSYIVYSIYLVTLYKYISLYNTDCDLRYIL